MYMKGICMSVYRHARSGDRSGKCSVEGGDACGCLWLDLSLSELNAQGQHQCQDISTPIPTDVEEGRDPDIRVAHLPGVMEFLSIDILICEQ